MKLRNTSFPKNSFAIIACLGYWALIIYLFHVNSLDKLPESQQNIFSFVLAMSIIGTISSVVYCICSNIQCIVMTRTWKALNNHVNTITARLQNAPEEVRQRALPLLADARSHLERPWCPFGANNSFFIKYLNEGLQSAKQALLCLQINA
jgi:hypothetical protein